MKYRERKPDYEDEYIRAWKVEKNAEEEKELKELKDIKINYKGQEFGLCGFTEVLNKEKGEALFYYKIKKDGDNWMMLYYVVDESRRIKIMELLGEYEKKARLSMFGKASFEVQDVRVHLNSALESEIIDE